MTNLPMSESKRYNLIYRGAKLGLKSTEGTPDDLNPSPHITASYSERDHSHAEDRFIIRTSQEYDWEKKHLKIETSIDGSEPGGYEIQIQEEDGKLEVQRRDLEMGKWKVAEPKEFILMF